MLGSNNAMPVTPPPSTPPPAFDWEAALGPIPTPEVLPFGWSRNVHPLTLALYVGGDAGERAKAVVERAVRLAEGRVAVLGQILDCHYHTARRLTLDTGMKDLAGQLRYQHGHAGPTGLGPQSRRRRHAVRT